MKLTCIDASSHEIDPAKIETKPQLCFIDGLHLDDAVRRDFFFCMKILSSSGAIVFHDAQITYNALSSVIDHLAENHVPFRAYNLPDVLFVVEVNTFPLHQDPLGILAANEFFLGGLRKTSIILRKNFRWLRAFKPPTRSGIFTIPTPIRSMAISPPT